MPELTLESLAARIAEIERKLADKSSSVIPPTRDWRSVVGISEDNEFTRAMQAEIIALREADYRAEFGEEKRP